MPTPLVAAAKDALAASRPQLEALVSSAKDNFVASFGDWVASSHRDVLAKLFEDAGHAKLDLLRATTAREVLEAQETFDTLVDAIDTIALADGITGKAHARAVMKSTLRQVLDTLAAVAGAVVGAVVSSYVPGAGAFVGTGVTAALNGLIAANVHKLPVLA